MPYQYRGSGNRPSSSQPVRRAGLPQDKRHFQIRHAASAPLLCGCVASFLRIDPAFLATSETRWDQPARIRQHFGYRHFTERAASFRLLWRLYTWA